MLCIANTNSYSRKLTSSFGNTLHSLNIWLIFCNDLHFMYIRITKLILQSLIVSCHMFSFFVLLLAFMQLHKSSDLSTCYTTAELLLPVPKLPESRYCSIVFLWQCAYINMTLSIPNKMKIVKRVGSFFLFVVQDYTYYARNTVKYYSRQIVVKNFTK